MAQSTSPWPLRPSFFPIPNYYVEGTADEHTRTPRAPTGHRTAAEVHSRAAALVGVGIGVGEALLARLAKHRVLVVARHGVDLVRERGERSAFFLDAHDDALPRCLVRVVRRHDRDLALPELPAEAVEAVEAHLPWEVAGALDERGAWMM